MLFQEQSFYCPDDCFMMSDIVLSVVMLCVIILSGIMLSVIMRHAVRHYVE